VLLIRRLGEEADARRDRLKNAEKAEQYYFDANEAIAWMEEQELYLMSDEKAKVGATSLWTEEKAEHFRLLSVSITKSAMALWRKCDCNVT